MRRMRPKRSRLPRVGFSATEPDSTVPEYTRKNVSVPCGSFMILNASAANGSSSLAWRVTILSFVG
jgi:hypothetical protein